MHEIEPVLSPGADKTETAAELPRRKPVGSRTFEARVRKSNLPSQQSPLFDL